VCEFCLEHGEGKKWYLQAKNYAEDLLSDARRRRYIEGFFDLEGLARSMVRLEQLARAPRFIRGLVGTLVSKRMKRVHYGQVVPIEEIEKIFEFVGSVIRVACVCRQVTTGEEKRYCYGVSLAPAGGRLLEILREPWQAYRSGPDAAGLEILSGPEALTALREHEREGRCHTVWTLRTPFIGGICNCDRADCLAMRSTVTYGVPVMFRAEFVAAVDPDRCRGCRDCLRLCQFGAMSLRPASRRVVIDARRCYGCGICRASCPRDAIRLLDRGRVPEASGVW
jgi:Pyruvate/2-oxoacid:ferredoxin oxidoreductase delta subunit